MEILKRSYQDFKNMFLGTSLDAYKTTHYSVLRFSSISEVPKYRNLKEMQGTECGLHIRLMDHLRMMRNDPTHILSCM